MTIESRMQHKELHWLAWHLADRMDIDEFDALVTPMIDEICLARGWEYNPEMYKDEFTMRVVDLYHDRKAP